MVKNVKIRMGTFIRNLFPAAMSSASLFLIKDRERNRIRINKNNLSNLKLKIDVHENKISKRLPFDAMAPKNI